MTKLAVAFAAAVAAMGCSKEESAPAPAPSAPVPSTPVSAASSAPAPIATVLPPRSDCPKGSSGPGTFDKPCEAKGSARLMEMTWTGKTDEKGPQFRLTNKSSMVILYGKVAVYFYDKSGKQLEVKEADDNNKSHPYKSCSGVSVFGGVMKAGEKAVLTFSCVKNVPAGTTAIEGEVQLAGFADASEKKSEFYWKNDDLALDVRKKGGVK